MREVERYGIHMAGGWIDDENNEECRLKVIRRGDRERAMMASIVGFGEAE